MDLSESTYLHFVERIFEAAESPERWRALYEDLTLALGARSLHMLGIDKRLGTLSYSDGANLPVEGELAYMHRYRLIDPRTPIWERAAEGEWLHFPRMLPAGVAATHPVYQEFLIPYDRRYNTMCKLVDAPEALVIFSVLSGEAEGPISAAAQGFLDRLLPHLQRACRMGIRNFVYSTQALVGHLLVDRLRQPVILMAPGGEVMHTNQAAQELLRSTRLVQVTDGRLQLPAPQLAQLLRQCTELEESMKGAAADASRLLAASASQFRSLHLTDGAARETMYAFFTMLTPQREMGSFGLRPVVMLIFYHPASAPPIDASLLYAVFGLTPAECRIATLLAEGLSPKEIAREQGTQLDTIRKQMRSIYEKTETHRQPDLIRLLLHLPHNAVQT
jgi:DNA-binding CsgD family transcriptional regulator